MPDNETKYFENSCKCDGGFIPSTSHGMSALPFSCTQCGLAQSLNIDIGHKFQMVSCFGDSANRYSDLIQDHLTKQRETAATRRGSKLLNGLLAGSERKIEKRFR